MMKGSRNAKGVEEWSKAGSFVRKPEKGWLHSGQAIKDGGVCYALKYLGCIEVLKSMRTLQYDVRQQVTKEAMYRCCEANGYKFSKRKKGKSSILKLLADHPRTVHSGTFISLTVSISGIVLTEMSSGEMISKHDMQGISFASGGEKDCPDIVGYVAKDAKNRRACHVLDCPQNLSYDVINTIGQAFELRYKMFLDDPPELLPVPRRFEGSIFGEEEQQPTRTSGLNDRTYDRPRDEPEDEFEDGYFDEFDEEHEYDTPAGEPATTAPLNNDSEHYQKPRSPPCEMSNYDTPHSTLESHSSRTKTTSMEFAVGTQFESAVTEPRNMPSYNNPLASVPTVENLACFNDGSGVIGSGQESNEDSSRVNWETFDEEIALSNRLHLSADLAPKESSLETIDGPKHNTKDYALPLPKKTEEQLARRTPPPLPKPYSRKNNPSAPSQEASQPTASANELLHKDWFHGPMSRQDAENLLVQDGDFLVRESTTNPGQYVLTGLQNGYPKHLLLIDPEGVVRTKDHAFESVDHLVRYHQNNKVPIISSGSVIVLRQPVARSDANAYDRPI